MPKKDEDCYLLLFNLCQILINKPKIKLYNFLCFTLIFFFRLFKRTTVTSKIMKKLMSKLSILQNQEVQLVLLELKHYWKKMHGYFLETICE